MQLAVVAWPCAWVNPVLAEALLPADQAFKPSARLDPGGRLELRFEIARGHYLYRDKLAISLDGRPLAGRQVNLPKAHTLVDPTFGRVATYGNDFIVALRPSVEYRQPPLMLTVRSQGCSAVHGVCYPPQTQEIRLERAGAEWVAPRAARASLFSRGHNATSQPELPARP
jgi:thiol:disulfide interchange protein DsbD